MCFTLSIMRRTKTLEMLKVYEDITAVDHINFEVKSGEIFGFLEPLQAVL